LRLLIAEPTKSLSKLACCVAVAEGFECDIANNTSELFQELKEHQFDIICLAPNIGKETGIGVLKKIRKLQKFKFTPIFLFTSSPDSKDTLDAISAGATDLITKSDFDSFGYFLQRYRESLQPLEARVLVIEDSKTQQEIYSSLLVSLGCQVDFSDNATEAFDIYQNDTYDLVITDIVLRGAYSGVALAGRIRRLKSVAGDVPILAVSGYEDPSREASLFSFGVSDYIKKPLEPIKFSRQVRSLIKSFQDYKELEKKSAQLIESDKLRIQFWANLSHEIRTPLNGVIGSLELINEKDIRENKKDYLEAAKSSSEMILSLLNDVLELTKAESGKLEFEPETINLEKALKQQLGMIRALADKKKVDLNYYLDPNISKYVECDLTRLNQVVANLLNNAIKFTSQGSINIHCEKLKGDAEFLQVSVTDTGIGIAQGEQLQIFEKFKQANDSVENVYGGTGVGLHIVKLIVSMWGGEISVESELGKGSCFKFSMPLTEVDKLETNIEVQPLLNNTENKRVLVVDDSKVNLMIAEGVLVDLGIECDTAMSGIEALEKIEDTLYSCIFMDCQMPNMSGIEATRKIRDMDNQANKNIPIVALTAHSADGYKEECEAAGMNDFLEKPFRRTSIIEMLNKYLL